MKKKMMFICAFIILPVLFIGGLVTAAVMTISHSHTADTTVSATTIMVTVYPSAETGTAATQAAIEVTKDATGHEIENPLQIVPVTEIPEAELNYMGSDKAIFDAQMNEFIIGYGYQNAAEIRFDSAEIKQKSKDQYLLMIFDIKTTMYKDPSIVVKYRKKDHSFEMQMW